MDEEPPSVWSVCLSGSDPLQSRSSVQTTATWSIENASDVAEVAPGLAATSV